MITRLAYLYGYIGVCEVISEAFDLPLLRLLSKPFLMPVLMYMYYLASRDIMNRFHKIMLSAFFFSWIGDLALMFTKEFPDSFLLGLGAFLITHLLYIISFLIRDLPVKAVSFIRQKPWLVLPFLVLWALLFYVIKDNLNEMFVPVLVYSGVIMLMAVTALNRKTLVMRDSYLQVFTGAMLFLFSDSCIALNKFTGLFGEYQNIAGIMIMVLYIAGQFLIANGSLRKYQLGIILNRS